MIDSEKYGPWTVIAGGSEGIGACIVAELAEAGINIVLIARKLSHWRRSLPMSARRASRSVP